MNTNHFYAHKQIKHHKSISHLSIQVSYFLINNVYLNHSIKPPLNPSIIYAHQRHISPIIQSRTHGITRTHYINFNGLNIRILHRIIYISNINYALTQAPSLLKTLGFSPCSLAPNTFQIQFYWMSHKICHNCSGFLCNGYEIVISVIFP